MSFSTRTILVVGLGLIGGSFARAARLLPQVERVIGFDLNKEECDLALALEVVDEIATDLESGVKAADLVMLAVPVKAIETVMAQISPWLSEDTILSDVGSTKLNIVDAARQIWPVLPAGFVPGHPIAGTEKSGVAASIVDLFNHRKVLLTPTERSDSEATIALARLWQSMGAEVVQMDPLRHDQVLAATSHLPHLLAFSLVDTLAAEAESTDIFRYAAGGFRDFTRIAASDPTMWHDVCFANKDQLLEQIDRFTAGVAQLREAVAQGDSQTLTGIFTRAKVSREHFSRVLERAGYAELKGDVPATFSTTPTQMLQGSIRTPGDRSISHRAVMLAAIAEGVSDIDGFIESEDSLATIQVFRDLGVVIEGPHQGRVRVYGVGLHGLQAPSGPLYFGNSSTSLRMFVGLLAAQPFNSVITGSEILSQQQFNDVIEPLREMGASIESNLGCLPIHINGNQTLKAFSFAPIHSSAQVKASLIMAAMSANQPLEIIEPNITRDHTERLLEGFGVKLERDRRNLSLPINNRLLGSCVQIPADLSFALAFALGGLITEGSDLVIENAGVNPTRMASVRLLSRMGAHLVPHNERHSNGEPVADLEVRSATLQGIDCLSSELAGVGDELPLLMVAMCCAQSESHLLGIDRLPVRQLELLKRTVDQLRSAGADIEMTESEVSIPPVQAWSAVNLDAGEHPILALALVMVSLKFDRSVKISGCRSLSTAFPEHLEQARRVGIRLIKE